MKRLLREPLLHFLVLGVGLFLVFQLVNGRDTENPGKIVVTQGKIENLSALFARTWQRPPTAQEMEGLIEEYIKEEILYREALALGLDKDDTIIRRRARQKMEFLSEDLISQVEPTDEELQAYLEKNLEAFRVGALMSFTHVYLSRDKRGDAAQRDAKHLLTRLSGANGRVDPAQFGDPFLLPHEYKSLPESEVAKLFDQEFTTRLLELKPGQWAGPVESGYGLHLVLVHERTDGRMPELAEVRDAVRREWLAARRRESNEVFYQRLRDRYTVIVESPGPTEMDTKTAEAR